MPTMFHASDARNRESIREHGLDWRRMGPAPGIAGSPAPEVEGVFLTITLDEARFFVRLRADLAVDVWEVDAAGLAVEEDADGWWISRAPISADRLRLVAGSHSRRAVGTPTTGTWSRPRGGESRPPPA
jgi:hypothetical protein